MLFFVKLKLKYIYVSIIIFISISSITYGQSFGDEKTALSNFVQRQYESAPFEGVKKLEGDSRDYYIIAVTYEILHNDSLSFYSKKSFIDAQNLAETGIGSPCVKYEMLRRIDNVNRSTFLIHTETLVDFLKPIITSINNNFSKLIIAPDYNYIVSVVTLDGRKHASQITREKVAIMKAKQQVNTMINGSYISSEYLINIDNNSLSNDDKSYNSIREYSMGFIQGLETLYVEQKDEYYTYVFYSRDKAKR